MSHGDHPARVSAGWYPDPWNPAGVRYWDGRTWGDPSPSHGGQTSVALTAPIGTDWNTPWIWMVTLLPLVPLALTLMVPWQSLFAFDLDPTDPRGSVGSTGVLHALLSPKLWLLGIASSGIQALCIYFAYLDYKQLQIRGVPGPFHWAWALLGSVYPIGRSVTVIRRTGRGRPPLWATIAVEVLYTAVFVVITVEVISAMLKVVQVVIDRLPT